MPEMVPKDDMSNVRAIKSLATILLSDAGLLKLCIERLGAAEKGQFVEESVLRAVFSRARIVQRDLDDLCEDLHREYKEPKEVQG